MSKFSAILQNYLQIFESAFPQSLPSAAERALEGNFSDREPES